MGKNGNGANGFELKFNAVIELLNTGTLLNKYIDIESKRMNYNLDYGHIMIGLITYGPMIQTELSEWMLCSRQRITLTLDRMENEGLVERTPQSHDRRINRIQITDKGLNWIKSNVYQYEDMIIRSLPSGLATEQIREMGVILGKLRNHLIKQKGVYNGHKLPPRLKFDDLKIIKVNK